MLYVISKPSKLGFQARQDDSYVGPAYDGSQGVDSEDVSGIPSVDYSGYQYFPDQNSYGTDRGNKRK